MKKLLLVFLLMFGGIECFADEKEVSQVEQSSYDGIDEVLDLSMDAIDFLLSLDEINIKVLSYVKHHSPMGNFDWNEGFKNSAKGIEGIRYLDENHGVGLTYITFRNSFDIRTNAGGFVYKYTTDEIVKDFRSNIKLYALYQKGYYGSWDNPSGFSDGNSDNKFWSPLVSVGFDYKNFIIDVVGTHNTLHAITLGYSIKL